VHYVMYVLQHSIGITMVH